MFDAGVVKKMAQKVQQLQMAQRRHRILPPPWLEARAVGSDALGVGTVGAVATVPSGVGAEPPLASAWTGVDLLSEVGDGAGSKESAESSS